MTTSLDESIIVTGECGTHWSHDERVSVAMCGDDGCMCLWHNKHSLATGQASQLATKILAASTDVAATPPIQLRCFVSSTIQMLKVILVEITHQSCCDNFYELFELIFGF